MVVPLIGYNHQGGHGKVHKVLIEGVDIILPNITFKGKIMKARNFPDARVELMAQRGCGNHVESSYYY